jgi:hypothetical protein
MFPTLTPEQALVVLVIAITLVAATFIEHRNMPATVEEEEEE